MSSRNRKKKSTQRRRAAAAPVQVQTAQSSDIEKKVQETEALLQEYYDKKPEYQGEVRQGDIFFFDKNSIRVGVEQDGGRPGIIVSNDYSNRHSEFVEVVYCTTQPKKPMQTHVPIMSLSKDTTALCEQIHTLSKKKIINRSGRCTDEEYQKVNEALKINLGIGVTEYIQDKEEQACLEKHCAFVNPYAGVSSKLVQNAVPLEEFEGFSWKDAYLNLVDKITDAACSCLSKE